MNPRDTLAAAAAATGYGPATLVALAQAALPGYRPGDALTDPEITQVIDVVHIAAQAGVTEQQVHQLIDRYRRQHAGTWREALWTHLLRHANARYQQPATRLRWPGGGVAAGDQAA